ncbi:mannitol dehydrogenase family protein [Cellulomonas hominis]|uniref:mannitol dehydrogenase family protein n=1 Tax=Cellulomonas hominis TaxID=156981 RepID=UPI001C0F6FC5|nr:mannitol dehydrogenase family protein [Cellulomonas hominis]MBU5421218.1 mannitol dehydrogenase family protein [Cellulomonas hominis]
MPSLNRSALPALGADLRPRTLPWELRPRTVHFGLGAFTRAHQSVYTEGAAAATGTPWGIAAVEPRMPAAAAALAAQDGLYSVTELRPGAPRTRVVGSVAEALTLEADGDRLVELLTDPEVAVVTATITEKGYYRVPGTDRLDVAHAEVAADLAATRAAGKPSAQTVVGRIAELLAARYRAEAAPISVVSCDNMAGNGRALGHVVRDFIAHSGWADRDAVLEWAAGSVAFPQTIVDRIVPATTGEVLERAAGVLGVDDAMAVAGEEYRQWVLEDVFAAERPAWEADGALVVPDIAPYQLMKLRLLNGSHSALAYVGLAAGADTVAAAMASAWGEPLVRALCAEVAPSLPRAETDPGAYADTLVQRFANGAIAHQLRQIGSDGSLKVVERWLEPLRALRGQGRPTPVLELALAAWANATRPDLLPSGEQRFGTTDPAAAALARAWSGHPGAGRAGAVAGLLRVVGAADLAEDADLVAAVAERVPAVAAGRVDL